VPRPKRSPVPREAPARRTQFADVYRRHARVRDLAERVYRTVREVIFRGLLHDGERLQERQLADALGVSRTPVRAALQRLNSEGFISSDPRQGFVVAPLTLQDIEDIYVLRVALEGVAARLAAKVATESDLTVMHHIEEQIEAALARGDVDAMTILNARFHDELCRAAKNSRLTALTTRLHDFVQRLGRTTLSDPARGAQSVAEHRALIEAIRRRDPEAAERIGQEHMAHAKEVRVAMYAAAHHLEHPRTAASGA